MRPGQKTANGTKLHYYEKTLAMKARKRFGGKTGMQLFFLRNTCFKIRWKKDGIVLGGGKFGNCSALVAKILTAESLEGGNGRLGASWSKIPREKCILVINQTKRAEAENSAKGPQDFFLQDFLT